MSQTQEEREEMAQYLERVAKNVRDGEVVITNMSQDLPYRRFWSKDRWEYFRLLDAKLTLTYYTPETRKAEQERLEKYLSENPSAEEAG